MDSAYVKNHYAATGKLNCNGISASAQLTLKSNIITTVSHVITDSDTCKEISKPSSCEFVYTLNGHQNKIPVESLVAQGYQCPDYHVPYADWAVMRLKYPAVGVTPYRVPSENENLLVSQKEVVAIAGMSVDFQRKDPKTGKTTFPKHLEDCQLQKIFGGKLAFYFSHNCSNSLGASGGSLLESDPVSPVLLGIFANGPETVQEAESARRSGKPNMRPFDEKTWSPDGVPVNGLFLKAIKNAADN